MDKKIKNELEALALKNELIELKNKSPLNENDIRLKLKKLGEKCFDLRKFDESLSYYKECVEIEKRILASNHSDVGDTLMAIGSVYENQGNYEEVMKCFKQSLEIYKQTLPSNHPSIDKALNEIGEVYYNLGKYNEAVKYFNQSLKIKKQTLPLNYLSIAKTLNNIGSAYKDERKYKEALIYHNQSLDIFKQNLPSNHSSIANTLNDIGTVYKDNGNYIEAINYYKQSLEIYKQNFPLNFSSIANTIHNIGSVFNNQERYEEALKSFNQSLEMNKIALPSNHHLIANTLHNIGGVYFNQEKYEEALKYYNQSLEMFKETLRSNHPSITQTLNNIGSLYKNQGKYESAICYFTDERQKEFCRKKLKKQEQKNQGNKEIDNRDYTSPIGSSKESLDRERSGRQNQLNEQQIKEEQNEQNKSNQASLKTLLVREVKSDVISSEWLTNDANSNELIEKVIDSKYKIDEYLGQGGFGKVFTLSDLDENNTKVIKFIKVNDVEWKREAIISSRLIHKNIVKYHDHFQLITKESLSHPCIITEYCQNGDLSKRIKETKSRKEIFPDKVILNWIFQATKGLLYLHSMSDIHRDIKPENILLSGENVVKLADLGSAKVIKQSIMSNLSHLGTDYYMSPEMLNLDDYSFPTDIWSLGCVLYELAFLESSFLNKGKEHPSGGSQLFSATIKRMLVEEPNNRIKTKNLNDDLEKLKQLLGI